MMMCLGGDVILFKSDLPGPQWLEGGGEGCCQSKCKNTVKEADYIVNTTTNKTLKNKVGNKKSQTLQEPSYIWKRCSQDYVHERGSV